ncbi:hypothetical protein [Brevundimonas aurantiaca]|jgi:hypothetical protein|uniref:hypothetical protein n=1 Tax=Brevundimonas aurantiaca TaxID=74316 RepID=UPI002FDE88F5|tara:strand:- start:115 stop:330 length:216 start_codon:yes stop_codon:yes gene_type:complete
MSELSVGVASLPDREDVVVEVWNSDNQIAEVYKAEDGRLEVLLFSGQCGVGDLEVALREARAKLNDDNAVR